MSKAKKSFFIDDFPQKELQNVAFLAVSAAVPNPFHSSRKGGEVGTVLPVSQSIEREKKVNPDTC